MNLISFKISSTKLTNCGRSFIALASILCFFLLSSLASADLTNDVGYIAQVLDEINTNVSALDLDQLSDAVDDQTQYLESIRNALIGSPGYASMHDLLESIEGYTRTLQQNSFPQRGDLVKMIWGQSGTSLLDNTSWKHWEKNNLRTWLLGISNAIAHADQTPVVVSNVISVVVTNDGGSRPLFSPDVLAANPWWSTNSGFALVWEDFFGNVPNPSSLQGYSFPDLMSFLSATLNRFTVTDRPIYSDYWFYLWGGANRSVNYNNGLYSFTDFLADIMKSNLTAQATYSRNSLGSADLVSLARVLSSNSTSDAEYIVNHLDSGLDDITNLLSFISSNFSPDILAGNPWWWTNSLFALRWSQWGPNVPFPGSSGAGASFPQIFSEFVSARDHSPSGDPDNYFNDLMDSFGLSGPNTEYGVWTFDDWLAEFLKTNFLASTYAELSQKVNDAYSGTDVAENMTTNETDQPAYSDAIDPPDTSDFEDGYSDTMEEASAKFQDLSDQFGRNGDPEIVVIPEFTVGGIHVAEYRGSLNTSLTRVAHAVCVFLYTVFFMVATVRLIKVEWAFWTSLGHFEGQS